MGTWNVENLFRPGADAGPDTAAVYAAKLDALAATITALAPDVLAVQEVGAPQALTDLADRIGGHWQTVLAEPDRRGIRVGFLSRLPLTEVGQVSAFPPGLRPIQVDDSATTVAAMGRPALHARVEADGRRLDLLTCHLKSKLLSYPGGRFSPTDETERARYAVYALNRRAAEAATVRDAATALLDGDGRQRALLVLGDLNDEPAAATTQILQGPPGSEIGTAGYLRPDQGDGQRLFNLAALVPAEQRYTRLYRGQPQLIDHILASHALTSRLTPGDVTTADTTLPSIGDDPTRRRNAAGSDHRPVIVDLPR